LTVTKHDGDVVIVVAVYGHEVSLAVAIEIGGAQPVSVRLAAAFHDDWRIRCWTKTAASIAVQQRDVIALVTRQGQIEVAVTIQVSERQLARILGGVESSRRGELESTVALTKKDADASWRAGHNDIRPTVVVDVADCDVVRCRGDV